MLNENTKKRQQEFHSFELMLLKIVNKAGIKQKENQNILKRKTPGLYS